MERWNNTIFSVCLITKCYDMFDVPGYFDTDHHFLPLEPVEVDVDFQILEAEMNFDNRLLYLTGQMKFEWYDKRKAGLSKKAVSIDKKSLENKWQDISRCTWLPSLINYVRYKNDAKKSNEQESLIVMPDGKMTYMKSVLFKLHCGQLTNNFPADKYICALNIRSIVSNSTTNYHNKKEGWPQELHGGGEDFKVHNFYTEIVKWGQHDSDPLDTFLFHQFSIGVTLSRDMPIVTLTFLIPSIAVSSMDFLLYVFGKALILRFALFPAYFYYMKYIDRNKTDCNWPPIALYLYSRFICDVFLLCWNITSATSLSLHTTGGLLHPNWQNNWKKRLLALIVLTTSTYVMLIGFARGDFFPQESRTPRFEAVIVRDSN